MHSPLDGKAIQRLAQHEHIMASQLTLFLMGSMEKSIGRKIELDKLSHKLDEVENQLGIQNKRWR